jgi:hypothetical protein
MLQCGKKNTRQETGAVRPVQHFPPGGRFGRGKALALGGFLGFNLNKIG